MSEVSVNEIHIGNRSRKTIGSIDSLERSIEQFGVLQPIGITPNKKLIFGHRRLQACRNIGKETIPCRVFDVAADDPVMALRLEREENEHRIDLAPSEKVEIARRIEESLAGRQGGDQKSKDKILPIDMPQGKSSDIAAKAVDMNRETYRQAKAIVDSGDEEAIQEMDSGAAVSKIYREKVSRKIETKTIKITLYNKPEEDAEALIIKAGEDYCTKLAIVLLKKAGHNVVI